MREDISNENVKFLDDNRRSILFNNVVNNIAVGPYANTAEFIYTHVTNVLSENERPLFSDNISMDGILRNSRTLHRRTIVAAYWGKGDLVFSKASPHIGGFVIGVDDDRIHFRTSSNIILAMHFMNAMFRRILIVEDEL